MGKTTSGTSVLKKGTGTVALYSIFSTTLFLSGLFLINAGCRTFSSSTDGAAAISQLILSGGEGYINFRIGETIFFYYYITALCIYFILPLSMFYEDEIRI